MAELESTAKGVTLELTKDAKIQQLTSDNEIYGQQLKYMQDHLASLRSLIQDKENIIENLMLRYDLGILNQDEKRKNDNLEPDEIEIEELRRKAEGLAQRSILENFELREMVNELRDENFHLRNEIYELQDKINRQVLQISKYEKNVRKRMKCPKNEYNPHLQLWLKSRNLLKQLNMNDTQFVKLCQYKMFQLFGFNDIIKAFIDKADTNKLQILFKHLKLLKVHYDEQNKSKDSNNDHKEHQDEDAEDEDDCDMVQYEVDLNINRNSKNKKKLEINHTDRIPNELLSYIYGYLSKNGVENIKKVCNRMAVVGLQEMMKCKLGVFNCNELLNYRYEGIKGYAYFGDNKNDKFTATLMKYSRYTSSMSHSAIFEQWALKYNIPTIHQLLYTVNDETKLPIKCIDASSTIYTQPPLLKNKNNEYEEESDSDSEKIDGFIPYIYPKQYMLFDKRNIIVLKKNCNPRKLISNTNETDDDIDEIVKKYKLVFLKYFDVEKQSIKIVSILLCQNKIEENDLSHYVENQFINIGNNQDDNDWYNKLNSYLGEMGGWNDKKLNFFNATNGDLVDSDDTDNNDVGDNSKHQKKKSEKKNKKNKLEIGNVLTFQLNPNHSWFSSTNTFTKKKKNWFNDIKMFIRYHKKEEKIKAKTAKRKRKQKKKRKSKGTLSI